MSDAPPTAGDDTLSAVAEDSGGRIIAAPTLLGNDTVAPDTGETLVIASVSNAVGGIVVLNGDGSVTFTPAANFNGPASFDYVVNDGTPGSNDTGHVTFNVTPVNDAPVIVSNGGGDTANVSMLERTTLATDVDATDPDSLALTYSIVGGADAAKFQIHGSTGALSFINAPNFDVPADVDHNNGYLVQVRVSDGTLSDDQSDHRSGDRRPERHQHGSLDQERGYRAAPGRLAACRQQRARSTSGSSTPTDNGRAALTSGPIRWDGSH